MPCRGEFRIDMLYYCVSMEPESADRLTIFDSSFLVAFACMFV